MSDQITVLPISALRECPTNPRQTYNQAKLEELADSIKAQGVLQPIVVRPLYPQGAPTNARERYEVIFGHRRLRAAKLAKLDHEAVPCIVREMADDQVAIAQLIENAQREDVSALEEAEGFRRLIDHHHIKVPQLIKQTGKSKSYVYARLKLLHLDPKVKAALSDGTLDAEIGVLIARLPLAVHAEAMDEVTVTIDGKTETVSYREARRALQGYLVDLAEAPFELDATDLSTTAPACTKCQRRSGNNPDLQGDLGDNICTSRGCYQAKSAVFVQRRINAAKEAGQQVIEGDQARRVQYSPHMGWMSGYKTLDDETTTAAGQTIKVRALVEQCGAQAPVAALLAHPEAPTKVVEVLSHEAIDRMRKIAAGEDPDAKPADLVGGAAGAAGQTGDDDDDDEDEGRDQWAWAHLPADEQAVLRHESWDRVRAAIIGRVRSTPRTAEDLRLVLRRELDLASEFGQVVNEAFGWAEEASDATHESKWCLEKLQTLSADDMAAILAILAIDNLNTVAFSTGNVGLHAEQRLAIAAAYGVDPLNPSGDTSAPSNKPAKKSKKGQAAAEPNERDPNTGDLFHGEQA